MRKRLELQYQAEQEKMRADAALREKQRDLELEQGASGNRSGQGGIRGSQARDPGARRGGGCQVFGTSAERKRGKPTIQALTPLAVMEKGFEALRRSLGRGTNVMIW